MEQIMKLPVDAGNVVISEDYKSMLKNLFSGCRVNFLLGAGFSENLLGTLSNNEVVFEALQKHQAKNEDERKKATILSAFCIGPFLFGALNPFLPKYLHMLQHLIHIKNLGTLYIEFFPSEEIQHWIDNSIFLRQTMTQ